MDNNESKYEDAVAKLKILLTASQNQQRKGKQGCQVYFDNNC